MQPYNRPRRPDPNTISYLRSLPLDEKTVHEEIKEFLRQKEARNTTRVNEQKDDVEDTLIYPQSILATLAAIDEVEHEVASLAGDEIGSQCIELLTRIGAPYSELAARKLLRGIQGYLFHLSIHRFGSHVVQTILEYSVRVNDAVLENDSSIHPVSLDLEGSTDTDIPSLNQLIVLTVQELCPWASQLSTHMCGSHVLRSLICILCGVEMKEQFSQDGREATKSQSKKKKGKLDSNATPHTLELQYINNSRLNLRDDEISSCRLRLTKAITDEDSGSSASHTLQNLACHVYGGPLLSILLRGLVYADTKSDHEKSMNPPTLQDRALKVLPREPTFSSHSLAEDITKKLLCWDSQEINVVIYSLAGEARGSHILETILRIANNSFYEEVCQLGSFFEQETIEQYIQHDVSNFVFQTLLCTARTKHQAELLIDGLDAYIRDGYVLDISKKRRGIFWRIIELSARFSVRQEQVLDSMRHGFSSIRSNQANISVQECIPKLLQYQAPTKDGERINLDPAGARAIFHFLRFVPRLCGPIIHGILLSYSPIDLELLACDSLASVCIFDGILDGAVNQKSFVDGTRLLLEKLEGRWVSLSLNHIGHHIVKKVFHSLVSVDDKAVLASELSKGIVRLNTKSCGRSIIVECAVKDFLESKVNWSLAMSKRKGKSTIVDEILPTDSEGTTRAGKRKKKITNDREKKRKIQGSK